MRTLPTWWKQPSFLKFKKLYAQNKDRALFFLGSGISIQAGLPNWRGLLEQMLRDLPTYLDGLRHDQYEELSRSISLEQKGNYPNIGSSLRKLFKEARQETQWRRLLEDILKAPKKKESAIHKAIVSLEWHSVVTTNYDTLVEEAYWDRHQKRLTVSRPQADNEPELEKLREKFIYKIHGDIDDPDSPIVLAKDDYDLVYDESDENQTQAALRGVLRNAFPILFAGYSHDDETMQRFYRKAMRHTPKGYTFALVPIEGPLAEVKSKISRLTEKLDINFIAYSPDDGHKELLEFFEYLAEPGSYDARYNSLINAKRPTMVMIHCGGTIGSSEGEDGAVDEDGPLKVSTISSRFDPRLGAFSDKLLDWYQDTYNLGSSVEIDVQWEVLQEEHQVFSENATPALWNAVLEKIEKVVFKYFEAPRILGDVTHLEFINSGQQSDEYKRLWGLFDEEREQYHAAFPGGELSQRQFISDFQSRYILGIVVLFGTDTMGYVVSALSFGLQHMPCPMIVTGSNQPPDQSITGRSQFFNKSDAWKNILTSFYFLQTFGHTLTDAFVCFGDTIHHGVNLRKIASEMGPLSSTLSSEGEPFVFRNLHIHGQYMFRLIDGVFCNNYYSSERIPYSSLVGAQGEMFLDLRHIRRDPLQRHQDGQKALTRADFCDNSAVAHVTASPGFPLIDVAGMCAPGGGAPLRAVVVEGFASGTYPTTPSSRFAGLLYDLHRNAVPVFLISQYGIAESQQKYEVTPVRGIDIKVTVARGMTAETALPIFSLVLDGITDEEWGSPPAEGAGPGEVERLVEARTELIKRRVKGFLRERPNILTLEIDPSNINKQQKSAQLEKVKHNLMRLEEHRQEKILRRGRLWLDKFKARVRELKAKYVILYKHDFSVMLNEVTRRDERKGAGPDGFAALSDLGFEYGLSLTHSVVRSMSLKVGYGYDRFFERDEEEQNKLVAAAREAVGRVTDLLRTTNIADVAADDICFPTPSGLPQPEGAPRRGFSFNVTSVRYEELGYTDEKYAAVSFSKDDSEFFKRLASGCNSEENLEKHYRAVESAYGQLLRNKWQNKTTSLDWLLVGIFKGVTCALAQFLRFDDLAVEASQNTAEMGYRFVFRRAAHCFVLAGDTQVFKIRLSYVESTCPSGDPA